MAIPRTITSLNSVFSLVIPGLFNAPVQLEDYSADTAFATDAIARAEVHIGVDGFSAAGLIASLTKMKIHFPAKSESVDIFEQWDAIQQQEGDLIPAEAVIDLPSIGKSFILTTGWLSNVKQMPDAKKTLGDQEFEITWESITPNPLA